MGELLHFKKAAALLDASPKSVVRAIKDDRFEMSSIEAPQDSTIPQYYIDADDPVFRELMMGRERGEPRPEWLDEPKKRKPRAPAVSSPLDPSPDDGGGGGVPFASMTGEQKRVNTRILREYGKKEGYQTKIWRDRGDGTRSFVTRRPGLVEPEDLQSLFPEGGDFFLVVFKLLSNGDWAYDPHLSRDSDSITVDPDPGAEPEAEDGREADPASMEDGRFIRSIAREAYEDRMRRGSGDNGTSQAIVQMQSNITEVLSSLIQTQNLNFQQMMTASQEQHNRLLEVMRRDAEEKEKQRQHDLSLARETHKADMERLRKETESREERLQKDHDRRIAEIEKQALLEEKKLKVDYDEREKRQTAFVQAMEKINSTRDVKLKELDDTRMALIQDRLKENSERVMESLTNHEQFFKERYEHMDEMFKLRAAMLPSQMWAEVIKGVGEKVGQNLPALLNALPAVAGEGAFGQVAPGGAGVAGQGKGPLAFLGGPKVGQSILAQIKSQPEGLALLREMLDDMAAFVEQGEPATMFGQKILSMVSTVPGFATAFSEVYMTPLDKVMEGVVKADENTFKTLSGEKGQEFWKALKSYVREYYKAMGAQPSSSQA